MRLCRQFPPMAIAALVACTDGEGPSNAAPHAAFTVQCSRLECRFTNASTDADGTIESSAWDFGDGSDQITTRDAVRTYPASGRFVVRLTVTDDDGEAATASEEVAVGASVYGRVSTPDYPEDPSRYLLFEDRTFSLQYVRPSGTILEYRGRYTRAGEALDFSFDDYGWMATGILQGDSLTVRYNIDMYLDGFQDGVYRLAPSPDVLAFGGGGW